jgi:hypothetical protein
MVEGKINLFYILFYSILFYSILFYSILFYSILFYSILFYSILFYSILFYSILFYSILFYSILFYSILFYSILFYSILFYSSMPHKQKEGILLKCTVILSEKLILKTPRDENNFALFCVHTTAKDESVCFQEIRLGKREVGGRELVVNTDQDT